MCAPPPIIESECHASFSGTNSEGRSRVTGWIVVATGMVIGVWTLTMFNRLVRLRNQARNAWADIDVQLARRHDLVPQLVAAVQGYIRHEQTVLTAVTELRSQALTQTRPSRLFEIESALEQSLARIFALQEAYPDLKASEQFLTLQRQLVEVEDHLQYSRRFYNGAVRDNNDGVQRFPDLLVVRLFGFTAREFYQAADDARAAPGLGQA